MGVLPVLPLNHGHKSIVVVDVKRIHPFIPRPTDYRSECSLLVVDNECAKEPHDKRIVG